VDWLVGAGHRLGCREKQLQQLTSRVIHAFSGDRYHNKDIDLTAPQP